jgi:hypothetical protein
VLRRGAGLDPDQAGRQLLKDAHPPGGASPACGQQPCRLHRRREPETRSSAISRQIVLMFMSHGSPYEWSLTATTVAHRCHVGRRPQHYSLPAEVLSIRVQSQV